MNTLALLALDLADDLRAGLRRINARRAREGRPAVTMEEVIHGTLDKTWESPKDNP